MTGWKRVFRKGKKSQILHGSMCEENPEWRWEKWKKKTKNTTHRNPWQIQRALSNSSERSISEGRIELIMKVLSLSSSGFNLSTARIWDSPGRKSGSSLDIVWDGVGGKCWIRILHQELDGFTMKGVSGRGNCARHRDTLPISPF